MYLDRYYCPNCDSWLDEQDGFDPNLPAWKCLECGQALAGDNIGNRYPDVVWFCDECGAILNNQTGFSDEYDEWECEECGYTNEISDSNIEYADKYEQREKEYLCPDCGSDLTNQYGFDPEKHIFQCTNCGTVLYGENFEDDPDAYEEPVHMCKKCGHVLNLQYDYYSGSSECRCNECWYDNKFDEEDFNCPNCGALLNIQDDFDSGIGIWKCTECGTVLYGSNFDDDPEACEDPVHMCRKCGHVINLQSDYRSWYSDCKCEECGYENHFDEDDYICPHCGTLLNIQDDFDKDRGVWKCTECYTYLFGDSFTENEDDYDGTLYRCEECGEILNSQHGFDDFWDTWTCTNCWHENNLNEEDEDDDEDDDYDDDEDIDDDDIETDDYDDDNDSYDGSDNNEEDEYRYSYNSQYRRTDATWKNSSNQRNNWKQNSFGRTPFTSIFSDKINDLKRKFVFSILPGRKIPAGLSEYDLLICDCHQIEAVLRANGFRNITCIPVNDLGYLELYREHKVKDVTLGNTNQFTANTLFNSNIPIKIRYHLSKILIPPLSNWDVKRKPYDEVEAKFRKAGFERLYPEPIYDLVFGLLKKDKMVEKVTINDDTFFDRTKKYKSDAIVKIKYHTFKKNKTL